MLSTGIHKRKRRKRRKKRPRSTDHSLRTQSRYAKLLQMLRIWKDEETKIVVSELLIWFHKKIEQI